MGAHIFEEFCGFEASPSMQAFGSAPPFVVPLSLRELESPLEDDERQLFAQKVIDIDALQPDEVEQLVKGMHAQCAWKQCPDSVLSSKAALIYH